MEVDGSAVAAALLGEEDADRYVSALAASGIEVVPFDSAQAEIALDAWRRYGKGRHPAVLNLGDCASYALAATLNRPLLFKGSDFSKTDIAEV